MLEVKGFLYWISIRLPKALNKSWSTVQVVKVFMSLKCVVKATVSKIKPCWLWHRLKEEKKLVRSVQLWV